MTTKKPFVSYRMPLYVLLSTALLSQMSPASAASPVPLLGEVEIQDVDAYALTLQQEAMGFLDSTVSDWDMIGKYERGLHVFSRPVKDNKLVMVRSAVVVDRSAQSLFELLTSPAGAPILDDTTTGDEDPVARLTWRDRASVTYSKTLPAKFPFPARSFVKATFFDSGQNLLVSKSVLYPALPPGQDGLTRAFNSFALRTVPLDGGRCRLEVVDYFDMRGWFPTWIANRFHTSSFCQSLHARLWQHLDRDMREVAAPVAAASASQ